MALNTIKPNLIEDAGLIICSALRTPRTGYLLCDGSAVSRTTYANLFSTIVPNLGTVTITIANPGVVTLANHGLLTGESIYLTSTGNLPTGLSQNTLYYVISVDTNTFRLATSYANALAGTAINTSVSQSGTHTLFFCPFGLGNGSTTFNIPDLRGAYMRGRGVSSSFTQNRTSGMGERLSDQGQGHRHWRNPQNANEFNMQSIAGGERVFSASSFHPLDAIETGNASRTDGVNGTPRMGNETRPNSVVLNYFIRF